MICGNVTLEYKGEEFTTTDLWGQDWDLEDFVEYGGMRCRIVEIEEADDYEPDEPDWDHEDYPIDGVGFADPTGHSSLRASTYDNPRNLPCPTCGEENRLTPIDVYRGYQCNACADRTERGW